MNLPNTLTILRIFFAPLLVAALVQEHVALSVAGVLVTNEWLSPVDSCLRQRSATVAG